MILLTPILDTRYTINGNFSSLWLNEDISELSSVKNLVSVLHHVFDGEDAEKVSGGFFVEIEIVVRGDLLIIKCPFDSILSSVICCRDERPIVEILINLLEICDRRIGRPLEIVPLIYRIIHYQSVLFRGFRHELPNSPSPNT